MLKTNKNHKIICFFMLIFLIVSCDSKRVFDEYKTITGGWKKDEVISFDFKIKDSLSKRNLFINLRNNNNYEFSNLFLITELNFPDGQKITDTLEYEMADKTGKFLGNGYTEIKESKLFYKENITFPINGDYSIKVRQAMRKNGDINGISVLNGITDLGFRIEKIN